MTSKDKKTIRKKRLFFGAALLGGWLVMHATLIIWDGLSDELAPADVIVVLGNKVEPSGEPSEVLQDRLDRALELFQQGLSPRILVSGGVGVEGFDEATVMKEYLAARGVPAEKIWVDSQGVNTRATAENTRSFLTQNGLHSALIVSHYYHLSRCKLAFSQAGVEAISSAHANLRLTLLTPYSIAREVVGYYSYLLGAS